MGQRLLRGRNGFVGAGDDAVGTVEPQVGATGRTGHGLGMEAAIARIVVLGRTGLAQHEAVHGGLRAVVREPACDGEAGAAVGAVDEGVTPAAIGGVEHFGHTIGTHGDIGRHECAGRPGCGALDDAEPGLVQEPDG